MARRPGGRQARRAQRSAPLPDAIKPVHPGEPGGQFKPLAEFEVAAVTENVFRILEEVGFADATPHCIDTCTPASAMSGGSPEQGLLSAACAQLGIAFDLPFGSAMRVTRGIEVTPETPGFDEVKRVCTGGEGHYLSSKQTLKVMQSEYIYPELSDRASPNVWAENGKPGLVQAATERKRAILASHYPKHITDSADERVRSQFPIFLRRESAGRE